MAAPRTVTEQIRYSARPGDDNTVELLIEMDRVTLVEEVIPDGQMAGMMGHRPVPRTDSATFELHPAQAEALYEELGRALGKWPR